MKTKLMSAIVVVLSMSAPLSANEVVDTRPDTLPGQGVGALGGFMLGAAGDGRLVPGAPGCH